MAVKWRKDGMSVKQYERLTEMTRRLAELVNGEPMKPAADDKREWITIRLPSGRMLRITAAPDPTGSWLQMVEYARGQEGDLTLPL